MMDEFEKMREDAHKYIKAKEEKILMRWLSGIGYTKLVGYSRNSFDHVMEIYTTDPGLLIGKKGVDVEKLKELLNEEFPGEWSVKFIEIRGGFVGFMSA